MATAPFLRTARMVVLCGLKPEDSLMTLPIADFTPGRETLAGLFFPRARVSGFVRAGQMLEIKVGIDLRRGDVGVAEQLLHPAQFSTGFKEMGGERVPEKVRVDMLREPLLAGPVGDAGLY